MGVFRTALKCIIAISMTFIFFSCGDVAKKADQQNPNNGNKTGGFGVTTNYLGGVSNRDFDWKIKPITTVVKDIIALMDAGDFTAFKNKVDAEKGHYDVNQMYLDTDHSSVDGEGRYVVNMDDPIVFTLVTKAVRILKDHPNFLEYIMDHLSGDIDSGALSVNALYTASFIVKDDTVINKVLTYNPNLNKKLGEGDFDNIFIEAIKHHDSDMVRKLLGKGTPAFSPFTVSDSAKIFFKDYDFFKSAFIMAIAQQHSNYGRREESFRLLSNSLTADREDYLKVIKALITDGRLNELNADTTNKYRFTENQLIDFLFGFPQLSFKPLKQLAHSGGLSQLLRETVRPVYYDNKIVDLLDSQHLINAKSSYFISNLVDHYSSIIEGTDFRYNHITKLTSEGLIRIKTPRFNEINADIIKRVKDFLKDPANASFRFKAGISTQILDKNSSDIELFRLFTERGVKKPGHFLALYETKKQTDIMNFLNDPITAGTAFEDGNKSSEGFNLYLQAIIDQRPAALIKKLHDLYLSQKGSFVALFDNPTDFFYTLLYNMRRNDKIAPYPANVINDLIQEHGDSVPALKNLDPNRDLPNDGSGDPTLLQAFVLYGGINLETLKFLVEETTLRDSLNRKQKVMEMSLLELCLLSWFDDELYGVGDLPRVPNNLIAYLITQGAKATQHTVDFYKKYCDKHGLTPVVPYADIPLLG